MGQFLMKPKIDFAFKEIMMDGEARTGFLAAMLGIRPEGIRETRILNPSLRKAHEDDKLGILDVRVLMDGGTEVDTEIQLSEMSAWADRSLFYLAKMFTEQLGKGGSYSSFRKCVGISILDFRLFKGRAGFYSCFHIREDTHSFLYTDKMEFHVVELPKLPKEWESSQDGRLLWAKFISSERKEDFDMLAEKDPYIKSAYGQLQVISQDKGKRLEYEAREKAIRDYNQQMYEAEQRGERRGRLEGEKQGRLEGEKQGRLEETGRIARNMAAKGFDADTIALATGLSLEDAKALCRSGSSLGQ